MKEIFICVLAIFSSIIIGSLFMKFSTGEDVNLVNDEYNQAKLFLIGEYNNLDDASIYAEEKDGVVVKKDDKYCVYVALLLNEENIEHMINYLNEKNIYYYIYSVTISDELHDVIEHYEGFMINTTSDVAFIELNKKVLERFKEIYEN